MLLISQGTRLLMFLKLYKFPENILLETNVFCFGFVLNTVNQLRFELKISRLSSENFATCQSDDIMLMVGLPSQLHIFYQIL